MREEDPYRVYTLQEAAERLRTPYSVVRDAVFAGRWPHMQVSPRKRLMTEEDIQETISLLRKRPLAADSTSGVRSSRANVRDLLSAA